MCRLAAYLGEELPIAGLITEPVNSIIHQSFHSHERKEPLNGDGFGISWYPTDRQLAPALFKSTTPAWSNLNLREISRVTRTHCLLAHVRAATPGLPVIEPNCHPFSHDRLTFMHNGSLGGFLRLRRRLLAGLSDTAFNSIGGSTDSEHLFALFIDHLRVVDDSPDARGANDASDELARALAATIAGAEELRTEEGIDEPTRLNLVVSDGERLVASRYASAGADTNSLYFCAGRVYHCEKNHCRMEEVGDAHTAVIIASEPLDDRSNWRPIEPGQIIVVDPDLKISTRPIAGT